MRFHIDILFKNRAGYDELVALIGANPRYVFSIARRDRADKRTRRAHLRGWAEVRHKQHAGIIKLIKDRGVCAAEVDDESGGLKLIGAWTSWLASNASDLIHGLDIRIE
jgi:hypothetical protein